VLRDGAELSAEDVIDHCAGLMTAYKVPKHIEFRESLPLSDVGKVLRRMLRDEELAKQESGA
jgi:long-chain acyl-CoA synthetase